MLEVERYPKGVLKMFSWPIKWYIVKFYALEVYLKYKKVFSRPVKLYIKGSFIVIQWNATGILNGILKFLFRWYFKKRTLKVCQRFTKGLLKLCL